MYNYPQYVEHDRERIIQVMQENPFATLIGTGASGRIEATQLPLLIDERGDRLYLVGHIARKLDHQLAFEQNPEVLAMFTSPHSYVSGTWYTGNLQQASTWNYISVHARGTLRFLDETFLVNLLKRLSLHFEKHNPASTTIYDNLPDSYRNPLVKAIVAFEIEVSELENVFKISQNRDEKSYDNIILQLEKQDDNGKYIARKMKENRSGLFENK